MPRKTADTTPVTLRIKSATLKRVREHANAHPLQPTLTQVFEAAIIRYLEELEQPKRPHAK